MTEARQPARKEARPSDEALPFPQKRTTGPILIDNNSEVVSDTTQNPGAVEYVPEECLI